MRPVFADPKTDLIFKRVFGRKSHQRLLIELLNDLLGLPEDRRIIDLEYLTPEQLPPLPKLKRSIVDVKCQERGGRRYIVEMQVLTAEAFEKRMVYNASRDYAAQIDRGELYPELNDVVLASICNFHLWRKEEQRNPGLVVPMVSRWSMAEEACSTARRFQQVRYVVMELPKYQAGAHPKAMVDRWAYFFREADKLQAVPAELSEGPLREALEVSRLSALNPDELEEYTREKIAEQDARGMLTQAKREGKDEGFLEGEEQGLKEGLKKGLKEGKDLGLKQGMGQGKAQSVLLVLKTRGLPVSDEHRAQILACIQEEELDLWLERAITAPSTTAVLTP